MSKKSLSKKFPRRYVVGYYANGSNVCGRYDTTYPDYVDPVTLREAKRNVKELVPNLTRGIYELVPVEILKAEESD